ncbi:hypothetical protein KC887_02490 [Candidatus Kaiserbacteria bacterium]|nr:hypothetical protein [Candidatus Kaiserbacteria bacterium]
MDDHEKATIIVRLVGGSKKVYEFSDFEQYSTAISAIVDTEAPPLWWVFQHEDGEEYILTSRVMRFTANAPQSVRDAWEQETAE